MTSVSTPPASPRSVAAGQKRRTRAALVASARELVAQGRTPSVGAAADAAAISRATAYRYFPNQRLLLVAAHPETAARTMLGDHPSHDPAERLDEVVQAFTALIVDTEPQQRTMLRLSLDPDPVSREDLPLRQGRAIAWISEALEPVREPAQRRRGASPDPRHPQRDRHRGPRLAHRHRRADARGGRRVDALVRAGPAAGRPRLGCSGGSTARPLTYRGRPAGQSGLRAAHLTAHYPRWPGCGSPGPRRAPDCSPGWTRRASAGSRGTPAPPGRSRSRDRRRRTGGRRRDGGSRDVGRPQSVARRRSRRTRASTRCSR